MRFSLPLKNILLPAGVSLGNKSYLLEMNQFINLYGLSFLGKLEHEESSKNCQILLSNISKEKNFPLNTKNKLCIRKYLVHEKHRYRLLSWYRLDSQKVITAIDPSKPVKTS